MTRNCHACAAHEATERIMQLLRRKWVISVSDYTQIEAAVYAEMLTARQARRKPVTKAVAA